MRSPRASKAFAAVLTVAVAGCASTGAVSKNDFSAGGADIPAGHWQGWGTYVECVTTKPETDSAAPQVRTQKGVYETSLRITHETLFGRDAVVFDIRSQRGKLLSLGESSKTHIRMALVRLPKLENDRTVYAVAEWHYNPKSDPDWNVKASFPRGDEPSATCVRVGRTIFLHVHYAIPDEADTPGFVDTFQFCADGVVKTGSIASSEISEQDDGTKHRSVVQIDWTERLTCADR